jgi:hypothetical protein
MFDDRGGAEGLLAFMFEDDDLVRGNAALERELLNRLGGR